MTRTSINLQYPIADSTDSVQTLTNPTKIEIDFENGMKLLNAFDCKDNTLCLVLENINTQIDSTITIKKGCYQNALLGDLSVNIPKNSTVILKIENPSRFEQVDTSLELDFSENFEGMIYAFAKKVGLKG